MNIFNLLNTTLDVDFLRQQLVPYRVKNRWGYVRYGTKEFSIDPTYDSALPFFEGFAVVEKKSKYGFIKTNGEMLVPLFYERVRSFSEGFATVGFYNYRGKDVSAFIDTSGNEVTGRIYRNADSFSEGLAAVWIDERSDNRKGFIDTNFNVVIDFRFFGDESYKFENGFAKISDGHYIDKQGKSFYYPNIYYEGLILKKEKGLFGFINSQNKIAIPYQFIYAKKFSEGFAVAAKYAKKMGYISETGDTVIEMKYSNIASFKNGIALIHGKGYIDVCGIEYWED